MKATVFSIGLSIWLALSGLIWLVGFGLAGKLYLPPLDLSTISTLYAPWLVLLTIAVRAWMGREQNA
ncbi:hypothetical protein [Croceicoccus sp. YJ47]|uniref:hypothetical protein n=1 Tax=Croceicoccus sp. YJ47 TaxID=2798724 RepID=UPI0019224A98|nr:hypothetical protein [Croceicoccus sp. YJ47]QQN74362.1 hypothetical protein JD971_00715 [Croceicoccus sp. YJ47]